MQETITVNVSTNNTIHDILILRNLPYVNLDENMQAQIIKFLLIPEPIDKSASGLERSEKKFENAQYIKLSS